MKARIQHSIILFLLGGVFLATGNAAHHTGYLNAIGGVMPPGANSGQPDSAVYKPDAWSFYKGECTSYVAYRLRAAGVAFHNGWRNSEIRYCPTPAENSSRVESAKWKSGVWSHAWQWYYKAKYLGLTVNTTPAPNAVYCSLTDSKWGHVGFVDSVNADGTASVSEYNWGADHQWTTRTRVRVNGHSSFFIHFIPNTAPTITNLSASSDRSGNITISFNVNDSAGDRVTQTDVWVRSGSSVVSGTYVNGTTYSLGAHRVVIPEAKLRGRLFNGSSYTVGVRAYDIAWLNTGDRFSNSFTYNLPTAATSPEITILSGSAEIFNGSNASVGNFGTVNVQSSDYRTYTVSNTGSGTLTIGSLSLGNTTDFSVYSYPASSVAPGRTTSFTLRFLPRASGSKSCSVSLVNNDSNENPYRFTVSGTGHGSSATMNAMDRFATSNSGWLGTYTGTTWQDSYFVYRTYSSGNYLANRIGTNEVWYQWSGRWYNGGTW